MEARRRAEGKSVEMFLDLAYTFKKGTETNFLEPHEVEEINDRIQAAIALMPETTPREQAVERARAIKTEYIAALGSLSPRVSAYLLRKAIELRYKVIGANGAQTSTPPRKGPEGTKPGVWWGNLEVELFDYPEVIDLPVNVAQWLVTTWNDDKVQNGLEDKAQSWANVFEKEIARLDAVLNAPKAVA